MFHAHLLRGDALDEACAGEDVDELLDRRKGRYSDFARTHLLQRVGPSASTSQAPTRAAVPRSRPRTLERSQHRPRTVSGKEGASTDIPRGTSGPSNSGSQTLLGCLAYPPDSMIRGWVSPSELSRQYFRVDQPRACLLPRGCYSCKFFSKPCFHLGLL